ncbi:MAG: hypothetical protein QM648_00740 [Solirubrobacterales bacterium]
MATANAKTSLAFQQLSKTLGAKPPKALDALPAADVKHLNEQVEEALARHQETMQQAENSIIEQAPRALRGTVRKILGA